MDEQTHAQIRIQLDARGEFRLAGAGATLPAVAGTVTDPRP
jgi:hypothetical protein